jgi:predicted RNA-binding Zn-ribbon protein involved in translation (DUF1610 family)
MPDDSEIHGNFDDCPKCGETITNLHREYDEVESRAGGTDLERINELECPHCGADLALVTELTHRLMLWKDAR